MGHSYQVDWEFCTVTLSSKTPGTRYLNCRLQTESKGKNYNKPNRTTMRRICALVRRKLSGLSVMYPFQMARSLPKPSPHAQLLRIHTCSEPRLPPSIRRRHLVYLYCMGGCCPGGGCCCQPPAGGDAPGGAPGCCCKGIPPPPPPPLIACTSGRCSSGCWKLQMRQETSSYPFIDNGITGCPIC